MNLWRKKENVENGKAIFAFFVIFSSSLLPYTWELAPAFGA
jgi:hypothetical protein